VLNSISRHANVVEQLRVAEWLQCVSWRVSMKFSFYDEPSLAEDVGTFRFVEADNSNSTGVVHWA